MPAPAPVASSRCWDRLPLELIELGEEVLRHLRNPDTRVRAAATTGIKQLKFYAEAQQTFRKAK